MTWARLRMTTGRCLSGALNWYSQMSPRLNSSATPAPPPATPPPLPLRRGPCTPARTAPGSPGPPDGAGRPPPPGAGNGSDRARGPRAPRRCAQELLVQGNLNGFHCWSLNVSSTHIAISIESGVNCPWRRVTPRSQAPFSPCGRSAGVSGARRALLTEGRSRLHRRSAPEGAAGPLGPGSPTGFGSYRGSGSVPRFSTKG